MKKKVFEKSTWQTVLSVFVLAIFAYFAIGSFGATQQSRKLPNGEWEVVQFYSGGKTVVKTGPVDVYKRFHGEVTRETKDAWDEPVSTEKCNWEYGERHGVSTTTFVDGTVKTICYEYGRVVSCEEKDASIVAGQSAIDLLNVKYPWYTYILYGFDFNEDYLKSFMDTLEIVLYDYETKDVLNEDDFNDYYDDAIDDLEDTPYDSIIQINNVHSAHYGQDMVLSNEFRLASIDRYWSEDKDTYKIVKNKYSNYFLLMDAYEVTESDFELFCGQYDSLLTSYGALDAEDDFFVDSIDFRIFRALNFLSSDEEETSSILLKSLEIDVSSIKESRIGTLNRSNSMIYNFLSKTPKDVATAVFYLIIFEYVQADLIMQATQEAYNLNKGVVMLPTVTTDFISNNSSTSVTIGGNVINDGGGEISSRGVVWSTAYNPILSDKNATSGVEDDVFEVILTDLIEGETYYSRSFTTNLAGTAYGNNVQFTATRNVGIDEVNEGKMNFKVYPNPAKEKITIHFNLALAESLELNIVNMQGQVVFQKDLNNLQQGENNVNLNISGITGGMYNCRLIGKGEIKHAQKIVITN